MTRTKRIYNKQRGPFRSDIWWIYADIAYRQLCMGNCHYCKDHQLNAHRKTQKKKEKHFAIMEV